VEYQTENRYWNEDEIKVEASDASFFLVYVWYIDHTWRRIELRTATDFKSECLKGT